MLEKEAKEAVIDRKLKEMQEKNKEIQRRHAVNLKMHVLTVLFLH